LELPAPTFGTFGEPASWKPDVFSPELAGEAEDAQPHLVLVESEADAAAETGSETLPGLVGMADDVALSEASDLNSGLGEPLAELALPEPAFGRGENSGEAEKNTARAFGSLDDSAASTEFDQESQNSVLQPRLLQEAATAKNRDAGLHQSSNLEDPPGTGEFYQAAIVQVPAKTSTLGVGGASPIEKPPLTASEFFRSGPDSKYGAGEAYGFTYDDELILEIRTSKGQTADTIIAYGNRAGIYIPLGAISRFLDLAIIVSDDGHYANGWFLSEERKLTINLRQNEFVVEGRVLEFAKGDAIPFDGELYLRAGRYSDLFPLALAVDLRDQSVSIETYEPFPFEQRLERELARQRMAIAGGDGSSPVWPRENTPWKAIDVPIADIEFRAVADEHMGERLEGDLRLSSDLAFMTAQFYGSASTRDGATAARLELGRQDPDAGLLGPMSATEFQLGDVSVASLSMGLRSTSGRGAYVTNTPIEQASVFDKVDLRGELPDGYEVELYRNNILIASTRYAINGRYEFLQVPVDYGLNIFRLVYYGPQGQRREEVRRINVSDGRLRKGQFVYSLGIAQKDVNLFDVYGANFNPGRDFGSLRASAEVAYGISSGLTGRLSGALFESDLGNRSMTVAGIRTAIGNYGAKFDVGWQSGDGKAAQLGLAGRLLGGSIAATHAEYRGTFIDEVQGFSNEPLRRASQVDFNTSFKLGGETSTILPVTARLRHLEFADGRTQTDAALRGSARLGGFLLSNTLDYSASTAPGNFSNSQLVGAFDLARLAGSRIDVRGSVGYGVLPHPKLMFANLNLDYRYDDVTTMRGSISHSFEGSETNIGLSAVRSFKHFTLGADGYYGFPSNNYSFVLRLGFSLGRNPLSKRIFVDQPGLALAGGAAIRAFRDANDNGRYDDGDYIFSDVDFFSGTQSAKTDEEGIALVSGLGGGRRTSLQVDTETLPDITLAPVTRGIEVVPRPGRIHVSDFAIVAYGEVEGTAYFGGDQADKAVSGLNLRLIDATGKVSAEARSEADGFFLFEQVLPGSYRIELEPGQASRLKIALIGDIQLTITQDGGVIARPVRVKLIQ